MDCTNVCEELVAYHKQELPEELSRDIAQHLQACDSCRRESDAVKMTLETVSAVLVPKEPSAEFRCKLNLKLQPGRGATSRSSRRMLAAMQAKANRGNIGKRFITHLRSSPYFAVSVAAHAAILALLIALPLIWRNSDEAPHPIVHTPDSTSVLRSIRIAAPKYERDFASGNMLDLSGIVSAPKLYIWPVNEDGYIAAYTDASLLSQSALQSVTPVALDNGRINIPDAMYATCLGSADHAVVVNLLDIPKKRRLEIWSAEKWNAYAGYAVSITAANSPEHNPGQDTALFIPDRYACLPVPNMELSFNNGTARKRI